MATPTISTAGAVIAEQSALPNPPPLILPPQTTAYTPSIDPSLCELSVYCQYLSQFVYQTLATHGHPPLAGEACEALHTTPFAAAAGGSVVMHRPECYPEGYFSLFLISDHRSHSGEPPRAPGQPATTPTPTRDPALAYPGDACLAGWTTACTATVTQDGIPYTQSWCCPPGLWTCVQQNQDQDQGGDGDGSGGSDPEGSRSYRRRRCASTLTGETSIWLTWDPPFTDADDWEWYTWPTWVAREAVENAATVFHDVFPQQLPAPAATEDPSAAAITTALGGG